MSAISSLTSIYPDVTVSFVSEWLNGQQRTLVLAKQFVMKHHGPDHLYLTWFIGFILIESLACRREMATFPGPSVTLYRQVPTGSVEQRGQNRMYLLSLELALTEFVAGCLIH